MDPFTSYWIQYYDSAYSRLEQFLTQSEDDYDNRVSVDEDRLLVLLKTLNKFTFGADAPKKSLVVSDPNHNAMTLIMLIYYANLHQATDTTTSKQFSLTLMKAIKSLMINCAIGRAKCRTPLALAFAGNDTLPQLDAVYPDLLEHMSATSSELFLSDYEVAEEFVTMLAAVCVNDDDNARIGDEHFSFFLQDIFQAHQGSEPDTSTTSTVASGLHSKVKFLQTLFEMIRQEDAARNVA